MAVTWFLHLSTSSLETAQPRLFWWVLCWKNSPEPLRYIPHPLHIVGCSLVDHPWVASTQTCRVMASAPVWLVAGSRHHLFWASLQGEQETQRPRVPEGCQAGKTERGQCMKETRGHLGRSLPCSCPCFPCSLAINRDVSLQSCQSSILHPHESNF